jgi:LacI family transcriptional regulator
MSTTAAAATLRSSNAGLIGLVINDLRNPFFTEFATSLQMALSAKRLCHRLANTDEDPALQAQVVGAMLEHGVSALVVSPAYGDVSATFDAIARAGVPTLQVLRRAAPEAAAIPFAVPDYTAGSRMATEHLLALGARRVAFVGGLEGREVTLSRMSGYLSVLTAAGIAPLHLPGRPGRAFGREAAARLAREHPDVDAASVLQRPCGAGPPDRLCRAWPKGRSTICGHRLRRHRGLQPGLARAHLGQL